MLAPSTEPLPRVHRLKDSKAVHGGRRPLCRHPDSLSPIPTLYHHRHITRCTTRGLTGLCAVYVRPEGETSS